jgi:hypothetical protein
MICPLCSGHGWLVKYAGSWIRRIWYRMPCVGCRGLGRV